MDNPVMVKVLAMQLSQASQMAAYKAMKAAGGEAGGAGAANGALEPPNAAAATSNEGDGLNDDHKGGGVDNGAADGAAGPTRTAAG